MTNDLQTQIAGAEQRIIDLKNNVAKRATLIKWGLGFAVVVLVAPLAITGLLGTIALIGIGILGLGAINGFPVLAQRMANAKTEALIAEANRHLSALKAEANKNPIETLENEQRAKHDDLRSLEVEVNNFEAEVENLRDTVNEEGKFSSVMKKGKEVLVGMERKLKYRQLTFLRAVNAVKAFDEKVDEAKAMYRVAMAAQRADAASGDNSSTMMRKILEDTAFNSVSTQVNYALAGLRTSLLKEDVSDDEVLQLEQSKPNEYTIDVHDAVIRQEKVQVTAR